MRLAGVSRALLCLALSGVAGSVSGCDGETALRHPPNVPFGRIDVVASEVTLHSSSPRFTEDSAELVRESIAKSLNEQPTLDGPWARFRADIDVAWEDSPGLAIVYAFAVVGALVFYAANMAQGECTLTAKLALETDGRVYYGQGRFKGTLHAQDSSDMCLKLAIQDALGKLVPVGRANARVAAVGGAK